RDVEHRIQRAEQASDREVTAERPSGVPTEYDEHARLLFEMQRLAYQSDTTRVATFMIGPQQSGKSYPQIGIADGHHPLSHHGNDPAIMAKLARVNAYHVSLFAEYLKNLAETQDGDGSLLDHVAILYGSAMGNSQEHKPRDLPIL